MSGPIQDAWPPKPEGWPSEMVWPPVQSLDDSFDKLGRAEHHLKVLRRKIEPFEQRDSHSIRCEVDAEVGEYTFYVEGLEEPPPEGWGLIVGDCLHNARTALDYLMVRLVGSVSLKDPRHIERIQFPIFDDPADFRSRMKKLLAPSEDLKHAPLSGYLARIEELQPFNVGNSSIWGARRPQQSDLAKSLLPQPVFHALPKALDRLSKLDNLDKHRIIHATWLGVQHPEPFAEPSLIPQDFAALRSGGSTYVGPLEDGAKVGSLTFRTPLPREWQPDQVDMKSNFPLVISIFDELTFTGRVLEILRFCLWGVRSVLTLFGPVFDRSEPPLPVTAIPNIDPLPFP